MSSISENVVASERADIIDTTAPVHSERQCSLCLGPASLRCGACKNVFYCCKDHQKEHWKVHKPHCTVPIKESFKPKSAPKAEGNSFLPDPTAWALGFASPHLMYEWLVDCYRMRVDDDYAYGGGNLHGLYDPDATKETIVADFLIFAKLAIHNKVIPQDWNWGSFLTSALSLIPFAFEKSDAKEKYGNENVMMIMSRGGRSLRFTGEIVYGTSIVSGEESEQHGKIYDKVMRAFDSRNPFKNESLFADVGGAQAWKKFKSDLTLL